MESCGRPKPRVHRPLMRPRVENSPLNNWTRNAARLPHAARNLARTASSRKTKKRTNNPKERANRPKFPDFELEVRRAAKKIPSPAQSFGGNRTNEREEVRGFDVGAPGVDYLRVALRFASWPIDYPTSGGLILEIKDGGQDGGLFRLLHAHKILSTCPLKN